MPLSTELATLLTIIYTASSETGSGASYAALTKSARKASSVDRAAYLGKTVTNTTQAVTHTLIAAGIGGTKALGEVAMAASGLSLLCSLPGAIDTIKNLGVTKPGRTTKDMYQEATEKTHAACKAMKTSVLVVGEAKHDNILRLLFNLPLDKIQDVSKHHDIFPLVEKQLVKQKRGDAISFYKKHLKDASARAALVDSFSSALTHYDKTSMKAPTVSLGEVASYLSLLDPEKDDAEIKAFSDLFKDLLIDYRTALAKDKDCTAALDETNNVLLNLMTCTYTGRANRKKINAKKLTAAKHVLTGVGVILSGALAVHTLGLSVPITAILAMKVASSTVSVVSTGIRVAKMVQDGVAAEDIAQLLTPEVIDALSNNNVSEELLKATIAEVKDYQTALEKLESDIQSLATSTHLEISEVKKDRLYQLEALKQGGKLDDLYSDTRFIDSIHTKIGDGVSPPEIYRLMCDEIARIPISSPAVFSEKTAKLQFIEVVTSLLLDSDEALSGAFAKTDDIVTFIKGTHAKDQEKASQLFKTVQTKDEQFQGLIDFKGSIHQESQKLRMQQRLLAQKVAGPTPIEKLLKASDYTEAMEGSQERIAKLAKTMDSKLKQLEGDLPTPVKEDAPTL